VCLHQRRGELPWLQSGIEHTNRRRGVFPGQQFLLLLKNARWDTRTTVSHPPTGIGLHESVQPRVIGKDVGCRPDVPAIGTHAFDPPGMQGACEPLRGGTYRRTASDRRGNRLTRR
jgi:hypothetical protein